MKSDVYIYIIIYDFIYMYIYIYQSHIISPTIQIQRLSPPDQASRAVASNALLNGAGRRFGWRWALQVLEGAVKAAKA